MARVESTSMPQEHPMASEDEVVRCVCETSPALCQRGMGAESRGDEANGSNGGENAQEDLWSGV